MINGLPQSLVLLRSDEAALLVSLKKFFLLNIVRKYKLYILKPGSRAAS